MKLFGVVFKAIVGILIISVFLICTGFISLKYNDKSERSHQSSDSDIFWHVRAFRPEAKLLKVKAITKDGAQHDVKAIQYSDDTSILDVKAFVNGKRLPIKILMNEYINYLPVKAIDEDGTLIDIKAVTDDGRKLDIKGVSKTGNIVHIRAISEGGTRFNIISISPKGKVNDVKGLKMKQTEVESTINNIDVFAHVKSIKQNR